jgi:uncharacterized membrane protein
MWGGFFVECVVCKFTSAPAPHPRDNSARQPAEVEGPAVSMSPCLPVSPSPGGGDISGGGISGGGFRRQGGVPDYGRDYGATGGLFAALILYGVAAAPGAVQAQQPGKILQLSRMQRPEDRRKAHSIPQPG